MTQNILEVIKNSTSSTSASFAVSDEDMEKIFKLGVYYGLFEEENYGEHDRRNSVNTLISTVFAMTKM